MVYQPRNAFLPHKTNTEKSQVAKKKASRIGCSVSFEIVLYLTFSYPISVLGEFLHPCEDDIVCKCTTNENKVPYFNAPVYLENKEQIGKVDEIFGQLRDFVSFLIGRPSDLLKRLLFAFS